MFYFAIILILSLYDFYNVKIHPRAGSLPLTWTVVEYHSQPDWANRGYFATPYRGYFATPSKWPPEPHFQSHMKTDLTTRLTDP